MEYKTLTEDGKALEQSIIQYREDLKSNKLRVKSVTATINATKQEMDRVQVRLQQKQDEKRAADTRDFGGGFGDEEDMDLGGGDQGMVIDEEELSLLREMKDLKKSYRDNYDKLKQAKVAIADLQANID